MLQSPKKDSHIEKQKQELSDKLAHYAIDFTNDTIKIDLHCHDKNSDRPDERLARIMGTPETWLETDDLIKSLSESGTTALTVTNHNNARTCYELQKRGIDILTGAEFSCKVPDEGISIHVLTYGFTESQEPVLNKLRRNVYRFLDYCNEHDIVTALAHPFYTSASSMKNPIRFYAKMALLFDRFEVMNGQRSTWQNLLTMAWVESLTPERLESYSDLVGIPTTAFCRSGLKKSMIGGSDSHMGVFAGTTGTYIKVKDLKERSESIPLSQLALEGLREGTTAPYGSYAPSSKMTTALLDYFCQCFMYMKDPGLLRMILHKGSTKDKVYALMISNAISELRRHDYTSRFLISFHEALQGKQLTLWQRIVAPKSIRPILKELQSIATTRKECPNDMADQLTSSLKTLNSEFMKRLLNHFADRLSQINDEFPKDRFASLDFLSKLEIPSSWRDLFISDSDSHNSDTLTTVDFASIFDGLSFPLLAIGVFGGASYASARVRFQSRELMNTMAEHINKQKHPKRALWLTDTFGDKNGVSMSLRNYLKEIQENDLPIDILCCDSSLEEQDHLIVVKPLAEFQLSLYANQTIRIPDLEAIRNIFENGGYDRVICSTELTMGLVALYLKSAFSIPTFFFMHTDWMTFAKKYLKLDRLSLARLRRILRAFYKRFDTIFVLNSDHKKWLASSAMQINEASIVQTRHWVSDIFYRSPVPKSAIFHEADDSDNILLYVGRLSEEKGLLDICNILPEVRTSKPNTRVVFVGTGPLEETLREKLPDAIFIPWVDQNQLAQIYSSATMMIFPSRFDTFGRVILESLKCGLPVAAYNCKGAKDIVLDNITGVLAKSENDMALRISQFIETIDEQTATACKQRANSYNKNDVIDEVMKVLDLEVNKKKEQIHNLALS